MSAPEVSPEERALYDAKTEELADALFGDADEEPRITSRLEARAGLVDLLHAMMRHRTFTRNEAIQFLRLVLREEEQRPPVDPA